MDEFPFSDADWDRVSQAAGEVVRASQMEDVVLTAAATAEVQAVLAELAEEYGTHPVLLETAADFTSDPHERVDLYRQARQLAVANDLPSFTILISLARVLIDELAQAPAAREYLLECKDEIDSLADDGEQREWRDLLARCGQK